MPRDPLANHTLTTYLLRRVSVLGAVALGMLLLPVGSVARDPTSTPSALTFVSNPSLLAPAVEVTAGASGAATTEQAPGYIFIAPQMDFALKETFVGQPGPEIFEADGNLVWQDPLRGSVKLGSQMGQLSANDFTTATYEGQPVLVWWQGYLTPEATGSGEWVIVNDHYQTIATVKPPQGYGLDLHEMQITPQGDAYVIASTTTSMNLQGCCKGPKKGEVYDQVILEIEIKTGKVIWSWNPLYHIPLQDSHESIPSKTPWNPYHLNSISFDPSGNLIVSARNTWAAYWVLRSNGQIFAKLGGKRSSFKLGRGVRFAWQHDVLQQKGTQISLFDDEAGPVEGKQSRGLLLELNWVHHEATVVHEYLLPHPQLAGSQGSFQMEPNGNVFIGWGQLPYFSEYTASGKLIYEGSLPGPDQSYRAFREPWVGLPAGNPSAVVEPTGTGTAALYASWNGATQVASWQLLTGASPSSLAPSGQPVARQGFQTAIPTSTAEPYYAVQALESSGQVLGTSPAVTAAQSSSGPTGPTGSGGVAP